MSIHTLVLTLGLCILLSACCVEPEGPRTYSPRRATSRPYIINGQCYTPQHHYELEEEGMASHYGAGDRCHGTLTSTGERFNMFDLTAAHKTLPLPCMVRVQNLENGRYVVLKVNDRGPFVGNRIIDVSARAAFLLGFYHKGLARVRVTTLVSESLALAENQPKKPALLASRSPLKLPAAKIPSASAACAKVSLPRLAQPKIYLSIKANSLAHALSIEEKLKGYGQTDLHPHPSRAVCVLLGPFPTITKAQSIQKKLAFYNATMIKK